MFATAGCRTAVPPATEGRAPASSAAANHKAVSMPFADYSAELLGACFDLWPSWGRQVGKHRYDGRVADYLERSIRQRREFLEQAIKELKSYQPTSLTYNEALDRNILINMLSLRLFRHDKLNIRSENPRFYGELFDVSNYIDFAYAPLPQRLEKLVLHQEAALKQVPHVLANLAPVLSKPLVETSVKVYSGYASYLRKDVAKLFRASASPELQKRFERSNSQLAAAAERIAEQLKTVFLPRADANKFALGKERYLAFVAAQEGRAMRLGELESIAKKDLERNRQAYLKLRSKVTITRPKASKLLVEATRLMNESRVFVEKHKLVTIVSDDRAVLRETPPYMRWNAAFLNMPGPFDKARQGFYYITLPDPAWPKEEQESYIFPYGTLMATTVHEVYPGHFLHGLWIRRAPTDVQKITESYSFTEGWAHYTEQLMIEQGFGKEDPQNRLGQLSDALLRNCRFVASIGLHAKGMTVAEAAELFEKQCFQDKATARQQAIRGTFDPGYFAYTLGKLQILELRAELKKRLGKDFNLQKFHDALLGHGSPPLALIRGRVLQELGAH